MKRLATILATFIIALTVQPTVQLMGCATEQGEVCSDNYCECDNGCSQNSDTKKTDANGCCSDGVCNPFQVCAYCCGGIVNKPSMTLVTSFIKVSFNMSTKNNLVLGFRSDCYRPPEIV